MICRLVADMLTVAGGNLPTFTDDSRRFRRRFNHLRRLPDNRLWGSAGICLLKFVCHNLSAGI